MLSFECSFASSFVRLRLGTSVIRYIDPDTERIDGVQRDAGSIVHCSIPPDLGQFSLYRTGGSSNLILAFFGLSHRRLWQNCSSLSCQHYSHVLSFIKISSPNTPVDVAGYFDSSTRTITMSTTESCVADMAGVVSVECVRKTPTRNCKKLIMITAN